MPLFAKHYLSSSKKGNTSSSKGSTSPLILIHGLFGSHENLGGIARLLADKFDVYSLDLPNHGRSPHLDSAPLSDMAELVYKWLTSEGLSKVQLLGHSLGGKVAMELALAHPEVVEKLVVMDIAPVHYEPHHEAVFDGLLSLSPERLSSRQQADEELSRFVVEPPVRSFLLKNLVKNGSEGFVWRMNLNGLHQDYTRLIEGNSSEKQYLGEALFLKGGNSDYIQKHHWSIVEKLFPRATAKIVTGTGHWLHAEKPEMVARIVTKFLQ